MGHPFRHPTPGLRTFPAPGTGGLCTGIWFAAFMNSFWPRHSHSYPLSPHPGVHFLAPASSEQLPEQDQSAANQPKGDCQARSAGITGPGLRRGVSGAGDHASMPRGATESV